jgi:hypothetical protein
MGKTVVAPNLATVRDVFTHGENAYLFEAGDVGALADALEELAADAELRKNLGRAGRDHVLGNHTWRHNALEIQKIFSRLGVG